MANNDGLVVGLDIGTTKVCTVIGERNEDGMPLITGVGIHPSTGLKKGVVVNIESTLRSVSAAIEAAEMMSGREVSTCWISIGGSHIDGITSRGVVAVIGRNKKMPEIGPEDITQVLTAARAVSIPMDRQVLEVIPQSYIVDSHRGIRNPLGMIGVRLEVDVYIITCSVTSAGNIVNCVNRAGYTADDLVLKSLAAGRAVLTGEEKEMGVVLIDLGGGTTDVMVYSEGSPYFTATIPAGGVQVTGDISIIMGVTHDTAEQIKRDAGCCWEGFLEEDDDIIVPGMGGHAPMPIPKSRLVEIIRPRMEEIYRMVKEKLDRLHLSRPLGGGIVLTGGGARLAGAAELAAHVFRMPVRVGNSLPVNGLTEEYRDPLYATAVGLVLEGLDREGRTDPEQGGETRSREKNASLAEKLKAWFSKEFF